MLWFLIGYLLIGLLTLTGLWRNWGNPYKSELASDCSPTVITMICFGVVFAWPVVIAGIIIGD